MAEGARKKPRATKAGSEPFALAVLTTTPSTKEAVATAVAAWQERWDDGFHDEVKSLIASHYPSDTKTLFDDVLAAFLFAEPEYCSSLLAPLIDALLSKRLAFSLRNAPFHSLQFAFTEAQAPGRGRTGRVFCTEVLSLLAQHAQSPGPCAWLTDALVDATPALRESFFASFLLGAQPGRLRSLVAILEEERRRFRSVNLSHAMAPALLARLDKERNGSAALEEFSAFLQLYFSASQDSAQHTFHSHKLVLSLIAASAQHSSATAGATDAMQLNGNGSHTPHASRASAASAAVAPATTANGSAPAAAPTFSPQFLTWLVGFLSAAQPPPSGWFAVHFLPPALQGIHQGQPAAVDFLRSLLAHPVHSAFLLGPSSNRIASLQAGRASERGGEVSALLSACAAAGPAVAARVLAVWQATWATTDAWADDWERLHSLLVAHSTLPAEVRAAALGVLGAFLACARRSAPPADLYRKLLWLLLAEPRAHGADLFGAVMSHAAALPPSALASLEAEAAECVAAVSVFELPHTVSFVLRAPSSLPHVCKRMLLLLNQSLAARPVCGPAVRIVQRAAPAVFAALRTRDPETRHAAAQLLSSLLSAASAPSPLSSSADDSANSAAPPTAVFVAPAHVSALLSALQDDFAFVADAALDLVQRLTAYEAFAGAALPLAWALLVGAARDAALATRVIGVLDSLVAQWHATVLPDLLRRVDALLFASDSAAAEPPALSGACGASHPSTHMLLLLERLCRYPPVRSSPETQAVVARAASGLGHYTDDVTIHQLKLLAACTNPTLDPPSSSSPSPASSLLASALPALVRSLASTDSTLRELSLLLLCWHVESLPAETRASSRTLLCAHIHALAQRVSPHDASLLLSAATTLESREV